MIRKTIMNNREDWLKERKGIGGSDSACIIGYNPWKSNVDLWLEKTGQKKQEEIGDNPAIIFGNQAEPLIRKLYQYDHPEMKVFYEENNLFRNDKYPFAHASLDGWLEDEKGRKGILEIKTSTISRGGQSEKWRGRVPNSYYCQILHYMMVLEADFAILRAYIRYPYGTFNALMNEYRVEREDVEEEIEYLKEQEEQFWSYVERKVQPPLVLPEI